MSKFKVGDRVKAIALCDDKKIDCCGTVMKLMPGHRLDVGVKWDEYINGHTLSNLCTDGFGWECEESSLRLLESNNKLNMKEKFITMFLSEPEKSFRKAGITNGDGLLTDDGQKVFLTWILKKNGDTFKTEVVDEFLKEEEE